MSKAKGRMSLSAKLNRDSFFQTSVDLPRIVEIDLAAIDTNPEQPRKTFTDETLEGLAASIEKHGVLQPILVRRDVGGKYTLIAGERRLRALKLLKRQTVPAIISDGDVAEIALIENLQREDLRAIEEAEAIQRLMDEKGYTQEEVGQAIGKKQNTVSALLSLNKLPEAIKTDYPTSDKVSKSWLIELAQIEDEASQMELWRQVQARKVTVREVRSERQQSAQRAPKKAGKTGQGGKLQKTAHSLQQGLQSLKGSQLEADVVLKEELEGLYQLLGRLLAVKKNPATKPKARAPRKTTR